MKFWGWVAAIFIGIPVLIGLNYKEKPKDPDHDAIVDARYGVETAIERQLRDPSSAEYTDVAVYRLPTGGFVTCGYVNANNAFGGKGGPKPFVGNATAVAIGQDDETIPLVMAMWQERCVTKTAFQP